VGISRGVFKLIYLFLKFKIMNIYDQLAEINTQLINDEMWLSVVEEYLEEFEVDNMDELIDKASIQENDGVVYRLLREGNDILSLKDDIDMWFDNDNDDDYNYDY
jgi:hypothetical protein